MSFKMNITISTGCPKKTLLLSGSEFLFYLGRGVLRGSFSPEIDWCWSHVPHMCPSHEKHVFWHIKDVFLAPKTNDLCAKTSDFHIYDTCRACKTIINGEKLPLNTPLPRSKTQNLTKVRFFGNTL